MIVKYGIPVFAVAAISFAAYSSVRSKPVAKELQPPSQPPVASFAKQVGAVGLVEAAGENVSVSLPVPGLIKSVFVKAGDAVRAGQPLFSIDDRDLRAELALRQSALALAQAKLARLEQSPRPEEVPPAKARVSEAQAQLADAELQLRLIESVKDKRAIREEDLLRRRRGVEAARARLEQAVASLKLIEAGTWKPDLEVARAEVKQTEFQVKRIEADLERLTMTSPLAGRVLQCKARPGEYAQAGQLAQPLLIVGRVDTLHVRADVDEKDAWKVRAGASAKASIRGSAEKRFELAFVRIEPYVVPKKNLSGDSTERVDTRVLQVIYALPAGAPVYAGQQMDLSIESSEGAR